MNFMVYGAAGENFGRRDRASLRTGLRWRGGEMGPHAMKSITASRQTIHLLLSRCSIRFRLAFSRDFRLSSE